MVVPTWIEFIAARNGTSSAGSSSPVLEKCSNSSAKNMKRCRSLRPCGSISVDSIFLRTGIGGGVFVGGGQSGHRRVKARRKAPNLQPLLSLFNKDQKRLWGFFFLPFFF